MNAFLKTALVAAAAVVIAGCSGKTGWKRISDSEVEQKAYSVGYAGTAQTYEGRVNASYDIDSYINGVDDYYSNNVDLPIEQIQGSLMNRMLDHNVYAYYSGVVDAANIKQKANYLSPKCWALLNAQTPSLTQGIHDAMLDLQKGKTRNDSYIQKGIDDLSHECVEQVIDEEKQAAKNSKKSAKSRKSTKKAK